MARRYRTIGASISFAVIAAAIAYLNACAFVTIDLPDAREVISGVVAAETTARQAKADLARTEEIDKSEGATAEEKAIAWEKWLKRYRGFDGTVRAEDQAKYWRNWRPAAEKPSGGATAAATSRAPGSAGGVTAEKNYTEDLGGGVTMEMVWVPGGFFRMGSPDSEDGHEPDEGPVHKVTLDGFWIGKTEVTQEQYEKLTEKNPSVYQGPNNPVEEVPWKDADAFCRKLSGLTGKAYALPTEAQWEYACRGGSTRRFSFGNRDSGLGKYGWFTENAIKTTRSVSQKKPNPFGLYDMHGNVFEWCADWYGKDYYASSPERNPQGPASGEWHVLRGGSWQEMPWNCRSAYRFIDYPTNRNATVGFRVARVPAPTVP